MTTPDLDCPDPENYAAAALQMQETALQVEARLYQVERTLRAAANRQTHVVTTTAARTGLTTGAFNDIAPLFVANTVTFTNYPGFGFSFGIQDPPGAGEYQIGVYVNAIASGAVTDNSHRIVRIRQFNVPPGSGGTQVTVDTAEATVFEANVGGGMDITVTGVFDMAVGDQIAFEMDHGNVGSTMNISIGAIYWITFLGSRETVEVF